MEWAEEQKEKYNRNAIKTFIKKTTLTLGWLLMLWPINKNLS
jgi:hypothetical protein